MLEQRNVINGRMAAPGFWDNQETAQAQVNSLKRLNATLKPLEELASAGEELEILVELAAEDDTDTTEREVGQSVETLRPQLKRLELRAMMSDPMDSMGAFVQIQAGEGGTDSSDWAGMLLRMYARWAEQREFESEMLEYSEADEAGIRSATIAIRGAYAYGYLKGETGNHRLIRISPFDSAGRRHTSFAAVDVVPESEEELEIEINFESDVREDTYRASGAGGQHVNKTDSAIRLTHLPTSVVVQCQSQRSQHKNRAQARKMLGAKLQQIEVARRDAELAAKRGQKSKIGFGGQTVRNYVLHPEQYVKDARTGLKVGNPQPVLDGGLDPFVEEFLRWSMGQGTGAADGKTTEADAP
jgi:peptide chain release factor 2